MTIKRVGRGCGGRWWATMVLLLLPVAASGQSGGEPTVLLTAYAGFITGPQLWHVRQPLCVWVTAVGGYQCEPNGTGFVDDTLDLTRALTAGFTAGGGMTWFFSPRLGAQLDFTYASEALQDRCTPLLPLNPDPDNKNQQTCSSFSQSGRSLTTVRLGAGLVFRPLPRAAFSPYVRAGGGFTLQSGEVLAAGGDFVTPENQLTRVLVRDSSANALRPFGTVTAGLEIGSGTAPRFRVEVSDLLMSVDHLLGPADVNGEAPQASRLTHNVSLTVGFSMVLSGLRGHRY